jgi:hypothetical protein
MSCSDHLSPSVPPEQSVQAARGRMSSGLGIIDAAVPRPKVEEEEELLALAAAAAPRVLNWREVGR